MYEMIRNDNIRSYRGPRWNAQPDPISEKEKFEEWLMNLTDDEYDQFLRQKKVRA